MRVKQITKEEALRISQTMRFGVISEGCIGVWGEGDTLECAEANALENQCEYAGASDLSDCWATELQNA